ncbi:AAA family ATPase [Halomonas sp. DN3]|uniref:AAA family ATPase n=1 Tax=Halomonas sp. DN3 TaxID=2953657 RepID=UPI00209F2C7A|nr:AAA family ATPase [Halomonas sp. DN3]USZ48427.1 AAA family ATPase [Halomonas sp. DN3]
MKPAFISRVVVKNFKSIGYCEVKLGSLTYLVGANGSGKSNFVDALHFVRDALGGLNEQVQHLIDQVRYRYDALLPPPYC